jgi:hypothetical protein
VGVEGTSVAEGVGGTVVALLHADKATQIISKGIMDKIFLFIR